MFMTKINSKTYKTIRNTIDNKNILFRRTTPQYGPVGSFSNNVDTLRYAGQGWKVHESGKGDHIAWIKNTRSLGILSYSIPIS